MCQNSQNRNRSGRQQVRYALNEPKVIVEVPTVGEVVKETNYTGSEIEEYTSEKCACLDF